MKNLEIIGCPIFKEGSGIHIKEKNKGKFTASAKAAGQSVQEHAKSVLNNPKATPLQKKRANFARNASKWKHEEGAKIHKPHGHNLDMVVGNGWMASNKKQMRKKRRSGDNIDIHKNTNITIQGLGGIIYGLQ